MWVGGPRVRTVLVVARQAEVRLVLEDEVSERVEARLALVDLDAGQHVGPGPDEHGRDRVEVPDIAQPTLATLEMSRVLGSEFRTPLPDRLVGDDDSALREQFLNIAQAQAKPVI